MKKCMIRINETSVSQVVIHHAGNRLQEEPLKLSDKPVELDEELLELLKKFFLRPFKDLPQLQFTHSSDLHLNECFSYSKEIFADPESFHFQSLKLAKHLYEVSDHPQIKSGEFYLVYFDQLIFGDEICEAYGMFKSENKETYLKVFPQEQNFGLKAEAGININKLDKGCLVLNIESEDGYRVLAVDHTNKGQEARYWIEKFLQLKEVEDNYYQTQHYLNMCKDFAMDAFPDAAKVDKLELARESARFFQEEEVFDKVSFHEKVLQEPEIIEAFENYKHDYQQEKNLQMVDEFDISGSAVKKMKKVFKSVIKLDKNFHIYVHGNRDYIRKGFDEESGMNYYQVFFKEES
jgi:hypothetical protein